MLVNLHEPSFGEEEIMAATEQMRTAHVTMGKQVRAFEEQCADYFGSKYALMCNSGSSANLLAIAALSNPTSSYLKPGDEVIVPALSWATSVWPIIQYGLVPVFIDCDLSTYNFDIEKLRAAVTEKTRAIMVVHVYGNPCDMDAVMQVAHANGLFVIEDTCESMGAIYKDKYVGTIGHIGTMSLYFSHHITTFEGGLCFSNFRELLELMRIMRAHGWSREADGHQTYVDANPDIDPRFLFVHAGYNLRPTEVQAVIGQKQLPKLSSFVMNRREMWWAYRTELEKYSDYFRFQESQEDSEPSWFGFCIVLKENCPFSLKEITTFLQKHGVENRPIIAGNMARHPAVNLYNHRVSGTLENCDTIMRRGFAIGCHHAITEEQVDYVTGVFDEFMKQKQKELI